MKTPSPRQNKAMKTNFTSTLRLPSRALYAFLIAIAVIWAMPRKAHAQLYVTKRPGGGNGVVSEYNATTGAAINVSFITGLTNEMDFGLAVSGNTLLLADINSGTVAEYDAMTGAAINASFIRGLNHSRCSVTPSS
jgi:hypothetical protein